MKGRPEVVGGNSDAEASGEVPAPVVKGETGARTGDGDVSAGDGDEGGDDSGSDAEDDCEEGTAEGNGNIEGPLGGRWAQTGRQTTSG